MSLTSVKTFRRDVISVKSALNIIVTLIGVSVKMIFFTINSSSTVYVINRILNSGRFIAKFIQLVEYIGDIQIFSVDAPFICIQWSKNKYFTSCDSHE